MKATTEDAWDYQEQWAKRNDEDALCLLDLRRRVEALEQRATPANEVISAHGCADVVLPAPAADRPLWEVMQNAHLNEAGMVQYSNSSQPVLGEPDRFTRAAEIDAVADWLDARAVGVDAVVVLHAEARRAREGA